jgi:leucyl aminopeptidase
MSALTTSLTGKEDLIVFPVVEGFLQTEYTEEEQLLMKKRGFTGKEGTTLLFPNGPDKLFVGMKNDTGDSARKAAAKAITYARKHKFSCIAVQAPIGLEQALTEGALLGSYRYEEYKRAEEKNPHIGILTKNKAAVKRGEIIAEGVIMTRNLVNRPSSDKNPSQLVTLARSLGRTHGFAVKVLKKKELEKLGMNSLLGVNRGSNNDPYVCILELNPKKRELPYALVGKGVTFDAGGLQIKPSDGMLDMKMDMAGAATVLSTITTLARIGHKGRVLGVMGLVENLLGPDAYKPKDILTAYNGTTIEVHHTDAEGRLVLADVLSYVEKTYKPKNTIDLATLTGATLYALGYRVASMLGNNKELLEAIKKSSENTDELVWELPLYNHYKNMMKGNTTDLRNIHKSPGSYGPGTITAAAFLSEFINSPWAHLDIAGTAYAYEEEGYVQKGGTGWGVRLLVDLITKI